MGIDTIISEAVANYENNRMKDAADAFRYLVQSSASSNRPLDVMYFGYRQLDAMIRADQEKLQIAELWRNLGIYALKNAKAAINSIGDDSQATLKIKESIYRFLGFSDEYKDVLDAYKNSIFRAMRTSNDEHHREKLIEQLLKEPVSLVLTEEEKLEFLKSS